MRREFHENLKTFKTMYENIECETVIAKLQGVFLKRNLVFGNRIYGINSDI